MRARELIERVLKGEHPTEVVASMSVTDVRKLPLPAGWSAAKSGARWAVSTHGVWKGVFLSVDLTWKGRGKLNFLLQAQSDDEAADPADLKVRNIYKALKGGLTTTIEPGPPDEVAARKQISWNETPDELMKWVNWSKDQLQKAVRAI